AGRQMHEPQTRNEAAEEAGAEEAGRERGSRPGPQEEGDAHRRAVEKEERVGDQGDGPPPLGCRAFAAEGRAFTGPELSQKKDRAGWRGIRGGNLGKPFSVAVRRSTRRAR